MISLPEVAVVGFVGTGVMGKSMAKNLLKAGYQVMVYNRTKSKCDELISLGAIWQESVNELASNANVIISIVGYPSDVEQIYFGQDGIIENAKKGTFLIDMTTSTPSLAIKIYESAASKEIYSLDAPVSGGDVGAQQGKLAIMVGGNEEVFEAVKPIFEILGTNIVFQGNAGAGQHTKMCNQIAIASNMIGVSEAMVYAKKAGLDPETVLKSIETGAAGSWSLSNLAPRMIAGNFEPGFYVKHFVKDMKIAIEESEKMGFDTPGLKLAKQLYDRVVDRNQGDKGTQVLYDLLDNNK